MEVTKMTVRIPKELLVQAKKYAHDNDTTLTRLITAYLGQIAEQSEPISATPIVKRLTGSLSPEVTVEDYQRYLTEKYERSA